MVLNLTRYSLQDQRCANLLKNQAKSNNSSEVKALNLQIAGCKKTQEKLRKAVIKYLSNIQMQIEISKFETVDDQPSSPNQQPPEDPIEQIKSQLQKFIISPFSERLQNFLNEIFVELGYPTSIFKDIKEAKKQKKTE